MEAAVQKRFEVKKWNAVALWAWGKSLSFLLKSFLDIHVDNCAICRNHIMDPCKFILGSLIFTLLQALNVKQTKCRTLIKSVQ